MPDDLTALDVVSAARRMLDIAREGVEDLQSPRRIRRDSGFCHIVVFGRSVTFALQHLRTVARSEFDEWYAPREEAMRQDDLLRWFHLRRSKILKEGADDHRFLLHVAMSMGCVDGIPFPSAGVADVDDGFYETMAEKMDERQRAQVRTAMYDSDPPTMHLGEPVGDRSLSNLAALYLTYLDGFVSEAEEFVESL